MRGELLKNTDSSFEIHNSNMSLNNLYELKEALEIIDDETFSHHVNNKKNDFAVWVSEAVGDKNLSKKLIGVTDRKKAFSLVDKRINELEGEPKNRFAIGLAVGMITGVVLTVVVFKILELYMV